jgi:L-alanine-DL-glutamate epimerase-like enolase superfamily enzyme
LRWNATTLVLVELDAGGETGTGWTYADPAVGAIVRDELAPRLERFDARDTRRIWNALGAAVRNDGRSGLASYAVAALDIALWDLRARLCGVALCDLFGVVRDAVPVYGSGGFTSYDVRTLREQLGGWAADGMAAVKMKVGRDAGADIDRVAAARAAIGPHVGLFVDANGGYEPAQAIAMAHRFADSGVTWFEQPVDHADLDGTARVRDRVPAGMEVTSGEYITDTALAARVAAAVDVLQADATRCGGYTGLLAIDGYCEVARKPLSTHCSPSLHLHAAAAMLRLRHMEWFHDHVRIERMLFDGFVEPVDGLMRPDRSRPGHGLAFRRAQAQRFAL